MKIMEGKKIAEEKFLQLKKEIEKDNLSLSLGIVKILKDPVSEVYVNSKKKALEKYGIKVVIYNLREDTREEELKENIKSINEDGVIVQLPLPENIKKENILKFIDVKKDVDVFSSYLLGKYYNEESKIIPPVVGAVDILLKEHNIKIEGKNIVLVGSGDLVGKPLSLFFIRKGGTVSILNRFTSDIDFYIRNADIVVSGTGVYGVINESMIKKGVIIIDAGTSVCNGSIMGDVNIKDIDKKVSYLAKVPGGVGPLTTYCLARNLLELKKEQND